MHLVTDENGNPVSHGDHHHNHEHQHTHDHAAPHDHHHSSADGSDKSLALLSYMYDHNAHHMEELSDVASRIAAEGKDAAAAKIREAVSRYEEGNDLLHEALHLMEQ